MRRRGHVYSHEDLKWDGLRLRLKSGRLLATVEPDSEWPGMHRVRLPNGDLTDMANLSWAKDAAKSLALTGLNKPGRDSVGAPSIHQIVEAAE
jgi:hypothetical protein